MGIVVFGCVFVDIKGYPLGPYIPGGRNAGRVLTVHGGVARNVVEDLANVGVKPSFVSVVDDTGIGRDVVDHLSRQGVDTRFISEQVDGMGTWLAVFDSCGDVVASISKRPELDGVFETLKEHGEEIFAGADSVVLEMDMDEALMDRIFSLAQEHGKKIFGLVSNMSIAMERRDRISLTHCFVCNKQEAELFFSEELSLTGEEGIFDLQQRIRQAGIRQMVVTLGGEGCVYANAEGTEAGHLPAGKVDVLDTTGCGDAFCAGLALGLTYGQSLKKSCEIGTRLATSVVGTMDSVCPRFRPEEFGLAGFSKK